MIRSELIEALHNNSKFTLEQADVGVKKILDVMTETLSQGQRIEVRGFGCFDLRLKKERNAHNPKTVKKLVTERKFSVYFKPGKLLKDRVDGSKESVDIVDE